MITISLRTPVDVRVVTARLGEAGYHASSLPNLFRGVMINDGEPHPWARRSVSVYHGGHTIGILFSASGADLLSSHYRRAYTIYQAEEAAMLDLVMGILTAEHGEIQGMRKTRMVHPTVLVAIALALSLATALLVFLMTRP